MALASSSTPRSATILVRARWSLCKQEIGPHYYKTIIEPVLRSEARRVLGRYTPEEIYSTKRDLIEREIREGPAR